MKSARPPTVASYSERRRERNFEFGIEHALEALLQRPQPRSGQPKLQAYPDTAEFIKKLGANVKLGVPGTVQERNRDLGATNANQK